MINANAILCLIDLREHWKLHIVGSDVCQTSSIKWYDVVKLKHFSQNSFVILYSLTVSTNFRNFSVSTNYFFIVSENEILFFKLTTAKFAVNFVDSNCSFFLYLLTQYLLRFSVRQNRATSRRLIDASLLWKSEWMICTCFLLFSHITPLCDTPSGIYILAGFFKKKNVTWSSNFPPGCWFPSGRCFVFFKRA